MTPMNHREIEFNSQKYWEKLEISSDNINDILIQNLLSQSNLNNDEKCNMNIIFDWIKKNFAAVVQEDLLMDYGKDCIRLYLFFEKKPQANDIWLDTWEECSLEGCYKFLGKYRRIVLTLFKINLEIDFEANKKGMINDANLENALRIIEAARKESINYLIKANTMPNRHNAIAVIMECIKEIQKELHVGEFVSKMHSHEIEMAVPHSQNEPIQDSIKDNAFEKKQNPMLQNVYEKLIVLMTPFAPYLSEELWQITHSHSQTKDNIDISVLNQKWKQEDILSLQAKEEQYIVIPVQVNSKTRKRLKISVSDLQADSREQIQQQARKLVLEYLPDKEYGEVRCIYIPNKVINFVYNV